jgi:hypothetical protein
MNSGIIAKSKGTTTAKAFPINLIVGVQVGLFNPND